MKANLILQASCILQSLSSLQAYNCTAHNSLSQHIWSYPHSKKATDRKSDTSERTVCSPQYGV